MRMVVVQPSEPLSVLLASLHDQIINGCDDHIRLVQVDVVPALGYHNVPGTWYLVSKILL